MANHSVRAWLPCGVFNFTWNTTHTVQNLTNYVKLEFQARAPSEVAQDYVLIRKRTGNTLRRENLLHMKRDFASSFAAEIQSGQPAQVELVARFIPTESTPELPIQHGHVLWNLRKEEDRVCLCPDSGFYAVFDGHRSYTMAEFARRNFGPILQKIVGQFKGPCMKISDATTLMERAFQTTHETARGRVRAGTTALVFWVSSGFDLVEEAADEEQSGERQLRPVHYGFCANAGDSRAVLCQNNAAIRLSYDHVAADEKEKTRIIADGGAVDCGMLADEGGDGALQVSRGLGNYCMEPGFSAQPYVSGPIDLNNPMNQFIVLASDGLWDAKVTDQDVVDMVLQYIKENKSPEECAYALATYALKQGSQDDTSVIVLFLNETRVRPSTTQQQQEPLSNHTDMVTGTPTITPTLTPTHTPLRRGRRPPQLPHGEPLASFMHTTPSPVHQFQYNNLNNNNNNINNLNFNNASSNQNLNPNLKLTSAKKLFAGLTDHPFLPPRPQRSDQKLSSTSTSTSTGHCGSNTNADMTGFGFARRERSFGEAMGIGCSLSRSSSGGMEPPMNPRDSSPPASTRNSISALRSPSVVGQVDLGDDPSDDEHEDMSVVNDTSSTPLKTQPPLRTAAPGRRDKKGAKQRSRLHLKFDAYSTSPAVVMSSSSSTSRSGGRGRLVSRSRDMRFDGTSPNAKMELRYEGMEL